MALRFLIIFTVFVFASVAQELFPVNIIHVNDMHARFDESNIDANMCRPEDTNCIGGYARAVTKVKELKVVNADKNPIYLNAADYYQGTLWYNLFRWNVTSHFLNLYPADAMVRFVFIFNVADFAAIFIFRLSEIMNLMTALLDLSL